jgi:hypothetical protein
MAAAVEPEPEEIPPTELDVPAFLRRDRRTFQ